MISRKRVEALIHNSRKTNFPTNIYCRDIADLLNSGKITSITVQVQPEKLEGRSGKIPDGEKMEVTIDLDSRLDLAIESINSIIKSEFNKMRYAKLLDDDRYFEEIK